MTAIGGLGGAVLADGVTNNVLPEPRLPALWLCRNQDLNMPLKITNRGSETVE